MPGWQWGDREAHEDHAKGPHGYRQTGAPAVQTICSNGCKLRRRSRSPAAQPACGRGWPLQLRGSRRATLRTAAVPGAPRRTRARLPAAGGSRLGCLAPTAATATCRCEQGRRQACQQQEQEQRRGHVDVLRNAGIVLRRANPQLLLQLAPRACTQAEAAHGTASATHSTRALTPWPPSEHMTASRAVPQKPSSCCSCSACCSIPCPCSCLCCTIS